MTKEELAKAFGAADITSKAMQNAMSDWYELYYGGNAEEEDPCQEIPYTVVQKLSKTAFSEYDATSENDFAQGVLNALDRVRKNAMQKTLIGGECRLKPVPGKTGFRFAVVDRRNMMVFGRNMDGDITDLGTWEESTFGNLYYTLLERRTVDDSGYLRILNTLYCSKTKEKLGDPVPLESNPRYEGMENEYIYREPVGSIGMAALRVPMVNCVDGSADAVSVYAKAARLIHNINRNEYQLNGEFQRAESRIIVSDDLLDDKKLKDHVFVGLDDDQDDVGVTIFSPAIREQSFLARKKEYLRNVESVIGLKRGLLSEIEAVERTATEITSSEGDYALTISELQEAWEEAVRECVRLCGIFGRLYNVPGTAEVKPEDISLDFGNGILYDKDATWQDYKDMVARGLLKPEIAVAWKFGMPHETPEDLAAVREKYMPELENLLA